MSRKDPSFGQLVLYMDIGAGSHDYYLAHNFLADPEDTVAIIKQFQENADTLNHLGKVFMFHEVIALPIESHSLKNADAILVDLVQRYIDKRCPNQLVYARIHRERNRPPHVHLCISSNEIGQERRKRLTKKQFAQIQEELEAYQLEQYPELGDRRVYTQEKPPERIKRTQAEMQIQKRTGKISDKQQIAQWIGEALEIAIAPTELQQLLKDKGLKLYQRGKTSGVIKLSTGRKYRLKTLGLDGRFEQLEQTINAIERQRAEFEQIHGRERGVEQKR